MAKAKGLGRGLDALLGGDEAPPAGGETLATLAIDALEPGRHQPRLRLDPAAPHRRPAAHRARGPVPLP